MFGTIKENIFNKLEIIYINEGEMAFKKAFNDFTKTIKENQTLKVFYEIYNMVNHSKFDNEILAREFVTEAILELRKLDKAEVAKLKPLTENKLTDKKAKGFINNSLDQLIFNENLNFKDRICTRNNLTKALVRTEVPIVDYQTQFNESYTKITETVEKLNEDERNILDLFVENDTKKINDFYCNLITETTDLVDKKIVESENIDIAKKLLEVKKKLLGLKTEQPNIAEVENISILKSSFI